MSDPVQNGRVLTYSEQFEGDYLEAAHLSKEVTVEIVAIDSKATVKATNGKIIDKPILHFKGAKRALICNKTNAKEIVSMHGDMGEWIGKRITLYPTTCDAFGIPNTPCIRVKRGPRRVIAPDV